MNKRTTTLTTVSLVLSFLLGLFIYGSIRDYFLASYHNPTNRIISGALTNGLNR